MQIAIASQNPMLIQSVSLMLSDPSLDMDVVDMLASEPTDPGSASPELVLYDAETPAKWRATVLESVSDIPVVIVVPPNDEDREIPGLEAADRLITPLNQRDLVTCVTSVVSAHRSRHDRRIAVGALVVDLAQRQARVDGVPLPLTRREFDIVEYLALRKGVTLTKEMFLDRLYAGVDEPEIKIVDVFVCKIRRKIREITGGDTLIDTVWGRGYVLHDPADRDLDETRSPDAKRRAAG